MDILIQNKLNKSQIREITELAEACDNYDAYFEKNPPTNTACFFLCYEETSPKKLLGFLSCLAVESVSFLPGDFNNSECTPEIEVEITAMTLPSARRQGIFSRLYQVALKNLFSQHITDIYCAVPKSYRTSSLTASYSHSEYLQLLTFENASHLLDNSNTANIDRIKDLIVEKESDMKNSIISCIDGLINCRLFYEESFTNLCSVFVKEPYRRHGYGFEFLKLVIQYYFSLHSKPLLLNVASRNIPACRLYEKLNFQIVEEVKYYRLSDKTALSLHKD